MWYRLAQNIETLEKPGYQDEMEFKSGLSKVKPIKDKIEAAIKNIDPDLKQSFLDQYNQIISSSTSFGASNTNLIVPLQKLYGSVENQIQKQKINATDDIKSLVSNRITLKGDIDQDKILKAYLDAKMADDFFSTAELGEDILEISRFFIMNATGPKFDIVKNILRNIRVASWGSDVISIIIAFYLNTKLSELINVLRNKKPFTFKEETAIALIESKIAINGMKIGISLNNIVNKNPLGQITGHIGSAGIYGLEQLQGMMGTDKSIKKLVSGN